MNAIERYTRSRDAYVDRALLWLTDVHMAEPAAMCVPVSALRAFLHMSSADGWLEPIIAALKGKGLVEVKVAPDGIRTLYFTEKFIAAVEGPARDGGKG